MAKFIKIGNTCINVDYITSIKKWDDKTTEIRWLGRDTGFVVSETLEEILKLIDEAEKG